MSGDHVGQWAAIATAVLWTFSALAWTAAGRRIGALPVSFLRLVITCLFLAVYGQLARGLCLPTDADASTWLVLGLSGFAGFCVSDLCLIKAFLLIGPRRTLLIQSLTPPLTAVLSRVFLGDELALRHWLAMAVTLAGIAWVVLDRADKGAWSAGEKQQGMLLSLLGAVAAAVGILLTKQGLHDYAADDVHGAMAATFIRILGGTAGYLVLVTLLGRWTAMSAAARHGPAMGILVLGSIVGPFLGVALSLIAIRQCHAGIAATIFGTTPVLILPFAVLLHGEKITAGGAGGAIVSVLGIALLML